ncbi:uncharacterized protein LOC117652570 [Thrips palmi]|uniref:Uncharacterized protein LOC117652570 n=1 Tax=Thrips palmi TaxID=161013 RepID=A0A6P9A7G3_THRPL|nr:uncharacterized protein LOC117652570 [Thrips palmi]
MVFFTCFFLLSQHFYNFCWPCCFFWRRAYPDSTSSGAAVGFSGTGWAVLPVILWRNPIRIRCESVLWLKWRFPGPFLVVAGFGYLVMWARLFPRRQSADCEQAVPRSCLLTWRL